MKYPVGIDSLELVCLHEAAHAVTALMLKLAVDELRIIDPLAGHAAAKIPNRGEWTQEISAAGYGFERMLFEYGYLVDANGATLDEIEFETKAMHRAELDRKKFHEQDLDFSPFFEDENREEFVTLAVDTARLLNKKSVEKLADALMQKHLLNKTEIDAIYP